MEGGQVTFFPHPSWGVTAVLVQFRSSWPSSFCFPRIFLVSPFSRFLVISTSSFDIYFFPLAASGGFVFAHDPLFPFPHRLLLFPFIKIFMFCFNLHLYASPFRTTFSARDSVHLSPAFDSASWYSLSISSLFPGKDFNLSFSFTLTPFFNIPPVFPPLPRRHSRHIVMF